MIWIGVVCLLEPVDKDFLWRDHVSSLVHGISGWGSLLCITTWEISSHLWSDSSWGSGFCCCDDFVSLLKTPNLLSLLVTWHLGVHSSDKPAHHKVQGEDCTIPGHRVCLRGADHKQVSQWAMWSIGYGGKTISNSCTALDCAYQEVRERQNLQKAYYLFISSLTTNDVTQVIANQG